MQEYLEIQLVDADSHMGFGTLLAKSVVLSYNTLVSMLNVEAASRNMAHYCNYGDTDTKTTKCTCEHFVNLADGDDATLTKTVCDRYPFT